MSRTDEVWAIVPAAGIGSRMQTEVPKQYLLLDGKPVLQHTLERLANHPAIKGIVVAIAENDNWWTGLELTLDCELVVASGGEQRADSVLNAITLLSSRITTNPWLLVHDAARPCLRAEDIGKMLTILQHDDVGGLLGMAVTDTVKRVDDKQSVVETVCRQGLWRAVTPQMFRLQTLNAALTNALNNHVTVTDEASAIEHSGLQPKMVEGHSDNIKITVPHDLALAELFLEQQRRGD